MKITKKDLKDYLKWLITPQDDEEQKRFRDVVDDHIIIMNEIDNYTTRELIDVVNKEISYIGSVINEDDVIFED